MTTDPFAQLCTELEMKQLVEDNSFLAVAVHTFYNGLLGMGMRGEDAMELTKFYLYTLANWERGESQT